MMNDRLLLHSVKNQPWLASFLLVLAAVSVAKFTFKIVSVLTQTFVLPGTNLKQFGAKTGSWAVVTGASDGIGREFASQLAKAGFNILLVARNRDALTSTAVHIEELTGSKMSTQIHLIDFSKDGEEAYENLASVCQGLDIGVLVNNVGKSHAMPVYFVDMPMDEMNDILKININATLRVTRAVLPGMIKRKKGLVLNVGSFAGSIPSPMLATYTGTKAFLSAFSTALAEEVRAHNIVVEHLNTYFVVSKLSKIRKPSTFVPLPEAYVRSALAKIGSPCGAAYSGRPATSTPYWSHALMDYAMTMVGCKELFVRRSHRILATFRERALKKMEREAKQE